jgi:hypothetical protein
MLVLLIPRKELVNNDNIDVYLTPLGVARTLERSGCLGYGLSNRIKKIYFAWDFNAGNP